MAHRLTGRQKIDIRPLARGRRVYILLGMSNATKQFATYIDDSGALVRRPIPADATTSNGPMIPLWRTYDALGRPSDMYQDSWGRPC